MLRPSWIFNGCNCLTVCFRMLGLIWRWRQFAKQWWSYGYQFLQVSVKTVFACSMPSYLYIQIKCICQRIFVVVLSGDCSIGYCSFFCWNWRCCLYSWPAGGTTFRRNGGIRAIVHTCWIIYLFDRIKIYRSSLKCMSHLRTKKKLQTSETCRPFYLSEIK